MSYYIFNQSYPPMSLLSNVPSLKSILAGTALCVLGFMTSSLHAQQVLKITAIPDESPTELARKAAPLISYLEQKLGMAVEFTPVSDYAASVEALASLLTVSANNHPRVGVIFERSIGHILPAA